MCFPVTKTTLFTRLFTTCLSPDNGARMRAHARTYTRAYSGYPPWIFDNPNWIPQLGARRWFSMVLALHRPRLSCKIVSPRPPHRKLRIRRPLHSPQFVGNDWHTTVTCGSFSRSFLQNFPIGLERRKMRIVTPLLKISELRSGNKRRMVGGVF